MASRGLVVLGEVAVVAEADAFCPERRDELQTVGRFDAGLKLHEGGDGLVSQRYRIPGRLGGPGSRVMVDPQELLEAWQRAALEAFGDGGARRFSVHVPLLVDVEPDEC